MPSNPVIIPVGFGEVTITYSLANGADAMNVFGIQDDSGETPNAIAGEIAALFATNVAPLLHTTAALVHCHARINRGGVFFDGDDSVRTVGGGSGTATPPQVAVLVKKSTGLAGRQFRGRFYVPAPAASNVLETGALAGGVQAQYDTAFTNINTALIAGGEKMFILHRTPKVGSAPAPTQVVDLVTDPFVATQRDRNRGR
jgi:hypothetical protein